MATLDTSRVERPRDVRTLLTRCMKVGRPAMIWGPPGIGKSELIAEIGEETGRPVIDMRLLLLEPTDIKGIPYFDPETKTMKWAQPSDLPTETYLSNAILFLDEINAAPPSVQAAAYQLILNRRVGEYHLPKGVSIICAGNRDSDKGVTYRMPSPLANRDGVQLRRLAEVGYQCSRACRRGWLLVASQAKTVQLRQQESGQGVRNSAHMGVRIATD
jgi:MoxR-like ATPase